VLLNHQRIATIRRVAEIARERRADAVLVAGDVFETHAVSDETIRRTLNALDGFAGPWVMLPGNHDSALAESPWSRIRRIGAPDNLALATQREPITLAGGAITVLPAPLLRRHEAADVTEWFDDAPSAAGSLRIGLAHGSVAAFLPAQAEAPNPIAHDRAERARLDYLALGDWHGTLRIGPRTWYSGTPEADRFKANAQGNLLHVRLDGPGAAPAVEVIPTGHYQWHTAAVTVHAPDEVAGIAHAVESLGAPLENRVVALTLEGTIAFETRFAVDEAVETLRARVHHLEVDDSRLIAEPSADDLDQIDRIGFVRSAVDALSARAADPAGPDRETARLALQILYMEHRKLAS
jgi:DNA repair exonuclease SbcCD nuclease subunit